MLAGESDKLEIGDIQCHRESRENGDHMNARASRCGCEYTLDVGGDSEGWVVIRSYRGSKRVYSPKE